ncbi:hypothetical protein [Schumannella soli]|uniref:WXG100 family type VII secretion target n=1 Tax=Schumannella soli TaxID=2590779 RepID=A0A506Y7A0_9MICO|nr:hypothetical protein [Schumannella soli]TPW77905.1 hypothetical protein FJ657_04490 [Schumannella soli]
MSDDRFAADPDRMKESGRRLLNLQSRVRQLASTVEQLQTRYPDAGGDGDFRKSYDTNYVPAADAAKEFMTQLSTTVEDVADGTTTVARSFAETEDSATLESRHQQ